MFKQNRTSLEKALLAVEHFHQIPVQTVGVKLNQALKLASTLNLYAYDAYMLCAAKNHRCAILTFDDGLQEAARKANVKVVEVESWPYSEARRELASLLERANVEGEVRIKRRNGEEFIVRPSEPSGSPLEVEDVNLGLTADEIVRAVRESRERAG